MILFIKDPKIPPKPFDLINAFIEVPGYKK
jgi:hypothetical protein